MSDNRENIEQKFSDNLDGFFARTYGHPKKSWTRKVWDCQFITKEVNTADIFTWKPWKRDMAGGLALFNFSLGIVKLGVLAVAAIRDTVFNFNPARPDIQHQTVRKNHDRI